MAGLAISDSERKARMVALMREREQYDMRANNDPNEKVREKYRIRSEEVAEQLRVLGGQGGAPHERATRRRTKDSDGVESR